jgi:hypothetical protein
MGNRTQSAPSPGRPARKTFAEMGNFFPARQNARRTERVARHSEPTQHAQRAAAERIRQLAGSPLDSLYRNHGDDVERVVRSSERLVRERFWLQPDARAVVTGAAQARVP